MDSSAFSRIITDEYSARILIWSIGTARTASEMSVNLGIPVSACYDRIKLLEKMDLLKCAEMKVSKGGKPTAAYMSVLVRASIFLEKGRLRIKVEMADGKVEEQSMLENTIGDEVPGNGHRQ